MWYTVAKLRLVTPYSLIGNTTYVYILYLHICYIVNYRNFEHLQILHVCSLGVYTLCRNSTWRVLHAQAVRLKCPPPLFFLFYCSLSLSQALEVTYLRVNLTPVEKWNLLQTVLPSVRSIYMSFTSAVLKPSTVMHMDNFMDWARYLNG